MKQNYFKPILLAIAVLLAVALPLQAQMVSTPKNYRGEYKQGEVIVKFKDDKGITIKVTHDKKLRTTSVSTLDKNLNSIGLNTAEQLMPRTGAKKLSKSGMLRRNRLGQPVEDPDLSRLYMMTFEETLEKTMKQVVEQLEKLDEVEYAYPNYYVYTQSDGEVYDAEPMRSQQWYLDAIRLPELWDIPKLEGAERPVIAILDTGVDITHPDLADNIWTNAAETSGAEGEDDDNNGFVDDIHGWSFVTNSPIIKDLNGHGTHCAGIAAAVGDNGIGITGANPNALIMPVTIMEPDGRGTLSVLFRGIDYAIDNGADVLSMSYSHVGAGVGVYKKAYQTAILVGAAGNNGASIYSCYPGGFPAALDFVLGVQASNEQNTQASFSNYDPDGPYFVNLDWTYGDWVNFEIWAPGQNILSTYPGGTYKVMSGTSMATPLVAGAVSRLLQTKDPERYRDVWISDIIEAKDTAQSIVLDDYLHDTEYKTSIFDVYQAYCYNEDNRNARISIASIELNDSIGGDGDLCVDAGEIIEFYPVIRSEWGPATNIKLSVMANPSYESASNIEIIENNVDFGYNLNSRGAMRSKNPLILRVADTVEDGHKLKLRFAFTCDNIIENQSYDYDIQYNVENGVEISGMIDHDLTLYPDVHYIVTDNLAIPEGVTLTIMPGVKLEFYHNAALISEGKLIAEGTPELPILFTQAKGNKYDNYSSLSNWTGVYSHSDDTISYCIIEQFDHMYYRSKPFMKDCIIKPNSTFDFTYQEGIRNNFINIGINYSPTRFREIDNIQYSNFSNCVWEWGYGTTYSQLKYNNYFNNFMGNVNGLGGYLLGADIGVILDHADYPSYLGSGKESVIRKKLYEIGNAPGVSTKIDLSNMPTRPYREAHGIVWKVVVDGYDAQDEFDLLPPLGVGRHKFEVYFNRDDMDTTITPTLAMGAQEPYNQIPIDEDGYWSVKDSVSVYTAFLTITGKLYADGLNRIYVSGAKDGEFFEIPDEYWRFNVLVQSAGSMATGFAAEAGMGNVKLTWNNENNDFEDAMGFNVYRYGEPYPKEVYNPHYDDQGNYFEYDTIMVSDTIRLNQMILDLETTSFTDYEVTPGETYYYYYKVLSTDLKEYDISNVVAATPLTSTLGDANASGEVDVADVITTVNYAAGMEPRPFIFEAADVNADQDIDILDVIGIIKIITRPNAAATASIEGCAIYSIEDGIVWVDSPIDLAGVQLTLNADQDATITATETLNGFEQVGAWMDENSYLFLAYNMGGRVIPAGKQPILNIGDAEITDIRLSDRDGHNILATPADEVVTGIGVLKPEVLKSRMQGIYDMTGRRVAASAAALDRLPRGIYIVNGVKVVKKSLRHPDYLTHADYTD